MITEIGAVKVRGGEVLGEFQTLVNPHAEIPAFIAVLTGISNSMVHDAPPIESALPAFLEFADGCVLVAHNAPFDVGFLQHFAREQGRPWPRFEVLDTAKLARRVITRDDAPNCKLSSLAKVFNSATTPNHRALSDARATVDVLHGLMERLGGLGVHTLEELQTFSARVSTAQRRKRHLAEGLPHAPGVYLFRDDRARVLYVGTSRDLRTRVRTYFTASETRTRMGEMVGLATSVTGIECATPLEAEVRELRLIAEHKPKYNRRSRFPEKVHFVKLTREAWPRLSLVRAVLDDDADYLGPFSSRKTAEKCLAALHDTFPVRQCSGTDAAHPVGIGLRAGRDGPLPLPLRRLDGRGDLRRRRAPAARHPAPQPGGGRRRHQPADERPRRAASASRRPASTATGSPPSSGPPPAPSGSRPSPGARRSSRPDARTAVAGRCTWCDTAGWPAAGVIPRGRRCPPLRPRAHRERRDRGRGTAGRCRPRRPRSPSGSCGGWSRRAIRLVDVDGEWICPLGGAARHLAIYDAANESRLSLVPFDEQRLPSPVHRPVR